MRITVAPPVASLLLLALLAGCAATAPGDGAAEVTPRPSVAVRVALPAGTVVRLTPPTVSGSQVLDVAAVAGWWREALRQSACFDVAGDEDGVPADAGPELQLHCDGAARLLTATLQPDTGPPLPLASVALDGPLPAAIDQLAWTCRLALGDQDRQAPVPVGLCYSQDATVVHGVESGLRQLQDGAFVAAIRTLKAARRGDGACPLLLDALAAAQALRADPAAARTIAEEALTYGRRLSAPTMQRLARSLLLARASLHADTANARDRELLQLGETTLRERPFDPQAALTFAIAANFLDRFDDAAARLRPLARRLPRNGMVAYHLGWAELALGNAAVARTAFERAAVTLPPAATALGRALALYDSGEHEQLHAFLDGLLAEAMVRDGMEVHDLRRLQSAHAILRGKVDEAVVVLLTDLAWLRQRPSLLQDRVGDFVDQGQAIVLLGHAADLQPHLDALADLRPTGALADAAAFLHGLCSVAGSGDRARAVETTLARDGGMLAWSLQLRAYGHRLRGELLDEYSALSQAARSSDSPLLQAALVRSLRAMGRAPEADLLRAAMQREMRNLHLRSRLHHPLLGPEWALAYQVG